MDAKIHSNPYESPCPQSLTRVLRFYEIYLLRIKYGFYYWLSGLLLATIPYIGLGINAVANLNINWQSIVFGSLNFVIVPIFVICTIKLGTRKTDRILRHFSESAFILPFVAFAIFILQMCFSSFFNSR